MGNIPVTPVIQFVNATINNPSVPKDPATRALIRKQAMKQAAETRRRDGSYGKHNLRQYPVFYPDSNRETAAEEEQDTEGLNRLYEPDLAPHSQVSCMRILCKRSPSRQAFLDNLRFSGSIPGNPSAQGYELVTKKNGFDIIDLSTLATYHVGRATAVVLSSDPLQMVNLLRFKQWSYLSYLPSLYGRSPCLNRAVDCIVARVRQILAPTGESGRKQVIRLYLKAIDSLQKALSCPRQRLEADVLCATEILALYELFDPSGKEPWIRHAHGAARLIQLRGPENFNTEFEKALFLAHSGPIMTESLLNNERCFLAQPAWQAVFQSVILKQQNHEISNRSEIVISILILKSHVSALFADITSALCCNSLLCTAEQLDALGCQARILRADLLAWHQGYETLTLLSKGPPTPPGSIEHNKRCEIKSTYLSCLMLANRLLYAVSVPEAQDQSLEIETQMLAQQTLQMEKEIRDVCPHTKIFLAQTVFVAHSIINTAGDWLDPREDGQASRGADGRKVVERWKFEGWCELFGRKVS